MKVKVGIYSLSSCEGCIVQILNLDELLLDILEKIEIVESRILGINKNNGKLDIAIVEGAVISEEELEKLRDIRARSKIVIALGDCACSGGKYLVKDFDVSEIEADLPGGRSKFRSYPLDKFVKVDYYIWGCPINKFDVVETIKNILMNRIVKERSLSVCSECILRETDCLIKKGEPCLGPITRGGCDALCPSNGRFCYGCRGFCEDANIDGLIEVFKEHGIEPPKFLEHMKKMMEVE